MIFALLVAIAAVQDSAAACSFDTAAHLRTDSVLVTLATGSRLGYGSGLSNEYADAAEVIHEYFQQPARLGVPIWARVYWPGPIQIPPDDPGHGLDGNVLFRLDSMARLVPGSIVIETLNTDLAASVSAAIERADSAHAFAPPSSRLLQDHGVIWLHFSTTRAKDPHVPLVLAVVPSLRLDRTPKIDWIPQIEYPAGLRSARISDRIVLQSVIDAGGHLDSTTVSLVQGHYPEFAREALRVMKRARFSPGKIEKCVVPVLVRLPIDFKVR